MDIAGDVKKTFSKLPEIFVPEQADNVKATIQIDLSGEGASSWIIKIANRTLAVEEGQAATPNMTLQMEARDYLALTRGQLNPVMLFAAGKIKFQGDMGLAMKFPQMFKRQ